MMENKIMRVETETKDLARLKKRMKGSSEYFLLLLICIVMVAWVGIEKNLKENRYLDWLAKERVSAGAEATIIEEFRRKPAPGEIPTQPLIGRMAIGEKELETQIVFSPDRMVQISIEEIGDITPNLTGRAVFDGQVMTVEDAVGYLGIIPKNGIAISFHGDSEATIHQKNQNHVLMSQQQRARVYQEKKESLERPSISDPSSEKGLKKHAPLILTIFGLVLILGIALNFSIGRTL